MSEVKLHKRRLNQRATITVYVPADLANRLERFPEINLSDAARKGLESALRRLEKQQGARSE